jgi:V-type H+-transporting ATPase subunit F
MLLAGIGHVTPAPNTSKNFLVVDNKTETAEIEKAFDEFTSRKDIGILLINQHVCPPPPPKKNPQQGRDLMRTQIAEKIRYRIDTYTAAFPAVLEIPSKEHPYDPEKDSVLRRVKRLFGE